MTPTPLQRLSEIVEAYDALDSFKTPPSDVWVDFHNAGSRLARFLCSPEAVYVLARVTLRLREGPMRAEQLERGNTQRWHTSVRDAAACLNTIAEQALKEPSHG